MVSRAGANARPRSDTARNPSLSNGRARPGRFFCTSNLQDPAPRPLLEYAPAPDGIAKEVIAKNAGKVPVEEEED